jgi:alpha-1,2-mannosyltransferase
MQEPADTPASRWTIAGRLAATSGLWVTLLLIQLFIAMQLFAIFSNDLGCIDLLVYRAGGRAVLAGNDLYVPDFPPINDAPNLPFTYPPFAALLFVPLALLPLATAKAIALVLNAVACAVLFGVVVVASRNAWQRLHSRRELFAPVSTKVRVVVFAAAIFFLLSEPVQATFRFGQINLVLAAAVAVDVLLPHARWPRGLLVGLAVAVKLTPVVFVAYFVITRQWRAAVVSSATALSVTLIGWILLPADTFRYFSSLLDLQARVGDLESASNQSVWGVVLRSVSPDSMRVPLWAAATVLVLALAVVAIAVSYRRGDRAAAMLAAAIAGLLCSPVSWGHHWVWLSAAATYFLVRWVGTGGMRDLIIGVVVAAVTVIAPWTFLPDYSEPERLWNPLQHMGQSTWAVAAALILVVFAASAFGARPTTSQSPSIRSRGRSYPS